MYLIDYYLFFTLYIYIILTWFVNKWSIGALPIIQSKELTLLVSFANENNSLFWKFSLCFFNIKAFWTSIINNNVATRDTIEPKLLIQFNNQKASGQSSTLLCIPFSPKLCWGKNVKFVPINNTKNTTVANAQLYWTLNILLNHKKKNENIANTAPNDST